jgi:tRNA dimethylallyltransferase
MVARGLVEEVRGLLAEGVPPLSPALRATGYREVVEHLTGRIPWAEACERAVRETRRYAKRQLTWFRHQEEVDWVEVDGASERAATLRVRERLLFSP